MLFSRKSMIHCFGLCACALLLLPPCILAQKNADKQAQTILGMSVPADCQALDREVTAFQEAWPDHRLSPALRFKQLECESDWDLVREQLGRLGRQERNEEIALKASERLIELLFLNGEDDTVISESDRFLAKFGDKGTHEQILMTQASSLFRIQNYDRARQTFLILILRYPKSELVSRAQFGLADTYFQQRDHAEALEQFNMARRKTKDSLLQAEIEMRVARCYQALGDNSRAIQALRKTQDILPDSPQAREAEALLAEFQGKSPAVSDRAGSRDVASQKPTPVVPTRPEPTPKSATSASSGGYTLQVGAFSQKNNAYDLLDALKLKGYDAYVLSSDRSGRIIYKIRVGQCINKQDATRISQRLLEEEKLNSYLTPCDAR